MKRLFILVLTLILLGCTAIAESAPAREFTVDEKAYDVYLDISTVYKEGVHYLEELGFLWDCALKMKSSSDAHDLWFSTTYLASDFVRYAALSRYATDKCDYSDPKELYPLFSSLLSSKGDNATSIVWAGLELEHNAKYVKYDEDLQPTLNEAMDGIRSIMALNRDYPFLTDLKNYYKEASYLLDYIDNFEDNYSGFQNVLATQKKNQSSFEIDFEFIFNPADFSYVTEMRYAEQQAKYHVIYENALDLESSGQYEEAMEQYWRCYHYCDSNDRLITCRTAAQQKQQGKDDMLFLARIAERKQNPPRRIGVGMYHTVGLLPDKTCIIAGEDDYGQNAAAYWNDVSSVFAGYYNTFGIHGDGSVLSAGRNHKGQCDVEHWTDIIDIAAAYDFTLGLCSDGTILAAGEASDERMAATKWTNIARIAAGGDHIVGLKSDQTVVATGDNYYGQCNVGNWTNIIDIAAGENFTAGLRSDGTVLIAYEGDGSIVYDLSQLRHIIDIECSYDAIFGLRADGRVISAAGSKHIKYDTSNWTDIVSIYADAYQVFGIRPDGSVVAYGNNKQKQCDVADWNLYK